MLGRLYEWMKPYIISHVRHILLMTMFTLIFILGIILILNSDSWNLGSQGSMELAGTIMACFGGIALLCELYIDRFKS